MRKRGIVDFDLCMVDPWSAGNFGLEEERGRRLSRALTWVRSRPGDNGYARPVENVVTVVDLQAMRVIAVEDYGVLPLPPEDANCSQDVAGRMVLALSSMATRFIGRNGTFVWASLHAKG